MMKDFAKKNVTKAEWFFSKEEKNDNKIRNPFFPFFRRLPVMMHIPKKRAREKEKLNNSMVCNSFL